MKGIAQTLTLLTLLFSTGVSAQVVTYCCDAAAEQQYMADMAGLGTDVTESFEAAPWTSVRVPFSQASITSKGLIWSRSGGGMTTTPGDSHDGNYEVYAVGAGGIFHPIPDGFNVQGDGITFNAFGGWYIGQSTKIKFTVDGDPNRVNFTGVEATVLDWTFLGFIDTTPFTSVEIREADEQGDETKIFWADDFTFSTSGAVASPGQLQFQSAAYSVAENGAQIQVTVTRTGGSDGAVDVDYATTDGSAYAGSDYTATSGTLNFLDGQTSKTINVPIIDDIDYEGDETFAINLNNATGGATLGTPVSSTVTIQEDEIPPAAGSLQFENASYSVAEDGASILVTVTRTGGSAGAVTVDYATTDSSATAGSDYTATSDTLNFGDGVMSQNFSVPILDDTDYEGDEAFSLNLSNAQGGASLGAPSSSTVTITENDAVPPAGSLQFGSATYGVAENGASVLVTVTRTGGSFGEVGVNYASSDGTATAGSDYTSTSNTLTFADGIMSQSFSITILDDTDYEGDESFQLDLSGVTGGASIGAPSSTTITITEDDPVPSAGSLQFSGVTYSVAEDGTSLLVTVTRTGGSDGAVSASYSSSNGTATAGADYAVANGTLNFADGDVSETFTVAIIDDGNYEGDEQFGLSLSNAQGGATIGAPSSATVTITEDDSVPPAGSLQFSGASYSVAENGTSLLVTVSRSGGSAGAVSVDYASSNGTATAGADYTAVNNTLNFADGDMSESFTVTILDDVDYEGDENFGLSLSNAQGGASVGAPSSATVTITENDAVPPAGSLQFSGTNYNVAENQASVLVTVTRNGGSFGAVSVNYESSNGTATSGMDYTPVNGVLNFADGDMSESFPVTILDDTVFEGDETFNLGLSTAQGGATIGNPSSATVTIGENDAPPVAGALQFGAASYSVAENAASVQVRVDRVGGSAGAVSVEYATSNGSAMSGSDYTSASGTLSFADGETSRTVDVALLDDSRFEGNETFTVRLSAPTGGASLGAPVDATVTITDNDQQSKPDGKKKGGGAMSPVMLVLVIVAMLFSPTAGLAGTVDGDDPHANHKKMMSSSDSHARSSHAYDLQGIGVTLADSTKTTLADLVSADKPVMVHFIFTTCTTICPVQAATFSQVQQRLGDEASGVQMISVSIDPEYDTPARLQDYAKKFRAGPQWDFLTGSTEQMIQVQKAFDAYDGNKMNHKPLTLLRAAGADEWVRLEGLVSSSDILEEYERLKSGS